MLLAESDWKLLQEQNPSVRLKKNSVIFSPYGTEVKLSVRGRAKVMLQNMKGLSAKTIVYVVAKQTESLLGNRDGVALAIMKIDSEGAAPSETEGVHRLTPVQKTPPSQSVSGGETQTQIDRKMESILDEFSPLFEGIGNAKVSPIHIYTKEGRQPVAQKQ